MPDVQRPIPGNEVDLGGEAELRRLARELKPLIEGDVRFSRHDRMLYATDASMYQVEPLGVVAPRSMTDVQRVVGFCAARGLPVLPRGGGTSLAGQAVNNTIVIDFSPYCDRLVEVDAKRRRARVQPGLVLDELNAAVSAEALMFGPDVATSAHATLGGMIGNNSAGARSILYGRTAEHIQAMDVLLADGRRLRFEEGAAQRDEQVAQLTRRVAEVVRSLADEIERRYPRTMRRVNGYNLDLILAQLRSSTPGTFDRVNLAHLFCGAEGTLGVMTEATVSLVETPRRKGLAIVAFRDVDEALAAVASCLEDRPAAVELVDDVIIDLARENIRHRRALDLLPSMPDGPAGAILYVEHFAGDERDLKRRLEALGRRFGDQRVRGYVDAEAITRAWALRKAGEPLLHGLPGARKPLAFVEDTAVDPRRLPAFVKRFRQVVEAHGTRAAYYAHASVGCLHIRPMICLKDDDDRRAMEAIAAETTDLVREFGGALSGEHGDGRVRSPLLRRFYGDAICEGFARIKAIFDPENRMNPGIITEPGSMTQRLRVKPNERIVNVPEVRTFFRYEHEQGFGEAVELCNGAGVCRRMHEGTMCPSYRATRDERHATRGRGNALRLAITGQFSSDGRTPAWDDEQTLRTLDLCLSCKACKSECPSNVDLAKLKAEYLAQGYARGRRIPLSARAIGRVRRLNRVGAMLPGAANALMQLGPARALANRVLGLDARRGLPRFAPSLYRWFRSRRPAELTAAAPAVILLPDCFTAYNEPHIGRAAVSVLEALGYRVILPRLGCCGRALISQGLLREAVATGRSTAGALMNCLEATGAIAVVGCEPSCISTIVDDWLDLEMDVDRGRLRALADRTMLIEDFIAARWERHPEPPAAGHRGAARPILVHGHCHQKALWRVEPTVELLRRLTGAKVELIDAGCCGMAGAFGYSPDHYDLSMRIGELSLFPAVRARGEAALVAPGTSCRHQILEGTGRPAGHPIEHIAAALGV
ncbi:MAG: FAD-linked oxidase C-terminal domain-containing protein [Planctomycetota bacterium]|nr:FAD-linked oxidase C-terminal domain-containing protein [Planctomycetota bacterium]